MTKKLTAWFLSIMIMVGIFAQMIPCAGATNEVVATAKSTKVDTSDAKFYVVTTDKAPVKLANITMMMLDKGSLIEVAKESGSDVILIYGGTSFRVNKAHVERAPETMAAKFNCTTKTAPLYVAPAEGWETAKRLGTNTLIFEVGTFTVGKTKWISVYDDGVLRYVPASYCVNAKSGFELKIKLTGNYKQIRTVGKVKITAEISPAGLSGLPECKWTSSAKKVAKVNKDGTVQGVSAGTADISFKVGDLLSATYPVTVTANIKLDVPSMKQGDSAWSEVLITKEADSSIGRIGCCLTSCAIVHSYHENERITPPEMMKKLKFSSEANLQWESFEDLGYTHESVSGESKDELLEKIYKQLKKGKPVILGGWTSDRRNPHYVVIYGYTEKTLGAKFEAKHFLIRDPGANRTTLDEFIAKYPKLTQYAY